MTGVISQRYGDIEMTADTATSILSSPGDCEMNWQPNAQEVRSLSMSLPVRVLEDFLTLAEHPFSLGNGHVVFDGALAAQDAQFVDLMSYIVDHFERITSAPRQGDLVEALLLESFVDMAYGSGFFNDPETAGLRPDARRISGDTYLVMRAEEFIRAYYHEPLVWRQPEAHTETRT